MKHCTRWRPDTCTCVVDYEWDDADPSPAQEHRLVRATICAAHIAVASSELLAVLQAESRRRSMVLEHCRESQLPEPATRFEGQWPYRHLRLSAPDWPDADRLYLMQMCDNTYGPGTVSVEP